MKKAYALVIACILSLTFICMPFTGVFAESDIGISGNLFSSCFAWYNGTPGVDSTGTWFGSSFEESSDSVESGVAGTTSFGVQCLLNTSGDYVDYQLNQYPFYSNGWSSPILVVQLLLDRSSYGGPVEDLAYQFYTDSSDVIYEPFYQFVFPRFTVGSSDYVAMNLFFNIGASVNNGYPHIKIMYDGTAANFIAMGMRFLGYRNSSDSITTAELYQLQTDLITSFNMARLLDVLEADSSDVDLSTIENALASMDAKLTTIISNTDNVETLLDDINTSIDDQYLLMQTFYDHFNSMFTFDSFINTTYLQIQRPVDGVYTDYTLDGTRISVNSLNRSVRFRFYTRTYTDYEQGFMIFKLSTSYHNIDPRYLNVYYSPDEDTKIPCYCEFVGNDLYIYIPTISSSNRMYVYIENYYENDDHTSAYIGFNLSSSNVQLSLNKYDVSWFHRIEYYIRSLLGLSGASTVSDDITSTAAALDQEAQSVESFESTYQTQLQGAHDDVDLTEYPINATNGMTYLQTYTNRAFVASNGFRVFIIYPIIFVLIGIFLRRFV